MTNLFQLSFQLEGHSQDVRSLTHWSNSMIIFSSSRDGTARQWNRTELIKTWSDHTGFVGCVCIQQLSSTSGYLITGGMDKLINMYQINLIDNELTVQNDADFVLTGHEDHVCCLDSIKDCVVSGSWDKTARVWNNGQCLYVLKGHESAVWTVMFWNEVQVLTGSADKSIRLWDHGKCIQTFNGHTDCIRGMKRIDEHSFVSCSNDGTLRIWRIDGSCLRELNGHDSFIYGVAVMPSKEIVSVGEDRTLRIWKDNCMHQCITLPCVSVWSVDALENGDISVGSSDSLIRVFTRDASRTAPDWLLEKFETDVASFGAKEKPIAKSKDALLVPGNSVGQVVVVDEDGISNAYQWDGTVWVKVGQVVDAIGSSRKLIYLGREYDYVFDVDIGDGIPPLKLPYNVGDNPYVVAQKFIEDNELSQSFLDQVANFITTNTNESKNNSHPKLLPLTSHITLDIINIDGINRKVKQWVDENVIPAKSLDFDNLSQQELLELLTDKDHCFPFLDLLRWYIAKKKIPVNPQMLQSILSVGNNTINSMLILRCWGNALALQPLENTDLLFEWLSTKPPTDNKQFFVALSCVFQNYSLNCTVCGQMFLKCISTLLSSEWTKFMDEESLFTLVAAYGTCVFRGMVRQRIDLNCCSGVSVRVDKVIVEINNL